MRNLIFINSLIYLLMNVFMPYKLLLTQAITDKLPLILGVGLITQAISTWFLGRIVDKHTKLAFIASVLLQTGVVITFTWVESLAFLLALEICFILGSSTFIICEKVIIASLTPNASLGAKFGVYDSAVAGVSGVALIISSFWLFNTQYLFLTLGLLLLIPNILIFKWIK